LQKVRQYWPFDIVVGQVLAGSGVFRKVINIFELQVLLRGEVICCRIMLC